MARYKTKRKISWKQIISGILVVVLLLGAVGIGIAIFGNDRKDISSWGYAVGDLDENNGTYKENAQRIYMKEMFACKGLRVVPKFDNVHTYQLFFYDYDGEFLECTAESMSRVYTETDLPIGAYYCRMVIAPNIAEDVNRKEFKVNWWEIYGYADDFTVSVSKDQTPVDYFEIGARDMLATVQENQFVRVEKDGNGCTEAIDVSAISELRLLFNGDSYATSYVVIYEDGTADSFSIPAGGSAVKVYLTGTPKPVKGVIFNFDVGNEYTIIATKGR